MEVERQVVAQGNTSGEIATIFHVRIPPSHSWSYSHDAVYLGPMSCGSGDNQPVPRTATPKALTAVDVEQTH